MGPPKRLARQSYFHPRRDESSPPQRPPGRPHEGAARGEDICKVVRAHQGRRPLVWLPTPGTERLDRSTFGLARDRQRYKAAPPQGNQGLCQGATLGYAREVKKCQHATIESHRLRHPFFRHVRSATSLPWLRILQCFRRKG